MTVGNVRVISVIEAPENNKGPQEDNKRDASLWNWLHIGSILIVFAICGSSIFSVPRINTIFYPEYWYETIYFFVFPVFYSSVNISFNCSVFLKEKRLRSVPIVLKVFAWNMLQWMGSYIACYIIWVLILELNHPMPLLLVICQLYTWVALLYGIWILFPRDLMDGSDFRNKMKTYILYSSWWLVMHTQKDILTFIFANKSIYIEWMFAIILPCLKEANKRILTKLVHKMAGADDEASNVLLGIIINVHYSLFIAIRLSGSQIPTIVCMTTIEFMLHLKMTYDLVLLQNKIGIDRNEAKDLKKAKQKAVMKLVLAELCEGMVPLAYAVGFSMMYNGPNYALFGVANLALEDLSRMFGVMFVLFFVDILSVLLNGCMLWVLIDLNIAQEISNVLQKYWHVMVLKLSITIFLTFNSKDINFGCDWTLTFPWITDEGRMMMIQNSTDLTELEKLHLLSN